MFNILRKRLSNILPGNSETHHPDEVIEQISDIANRVLNWINAKWNNLPSPKSFIQELTIAIPWSWWIQPFFREITELFIWKYTLPTELESYLIAQWNSIKWVGKVPIIAIKEAFLDIYVLQIIWIHYNIPSGVLKKVIYNNMKYWNPYKSNWDIQTTITYYIKR